MSKKKKSYTGTKIGLGTVLGGAIIIEGIKNFLFGSPPKTWRKTIVYGGLATYFLGNLYSDQVTKVYNDFWDYQNSMQAQKLEQITTERDSLQSRYSRIEEQKGMMAARTDTLEQMLKSLNQVKEEEINNLKTRLNTYESDLEERTRELNEQRSIQQRRDRERREERHISRQGASANQNNQERTNSRRQQRNERPDTTGEVNWYSARNNDTAESIARTYLGSEEKIQVLKNLNPNIDEIMIGTPVLLPDEIISNIGVNRGKLPGRIIQRYSNSTFNRVAQAGCNVNSWGQAARARRKVEKFNLERNNFRERARGKNQIFYLPEDC